jgi:hypothetical protein
MNRLRTILVVLLAVASSRTAAAELFDGLPASVRAADPRLAGKVTLFTSSKPLGFLLEDVARQTGIAVSAEEKYAASERVCVYVKAMPAGELLDSLWSLLSYRRHRWKIRVTSVRGVPQYRLEQSPESIRLPEDVDNTEVENSLKEWNALIKAADALPSQREKILRELQRWRHPDQDDYPKRVSSMKWGWDAFKALGEIVPEAARRDFLKNMRSVTVPLDSSPSARRYAETMVGLFWKMFEETGQPEKIAKLQVSSTVIAYVGTYQDSRVRTLYLRNGEVGGPNHIGFTDDCERFFATWRTPWYLEGDTETPPFGDEPAQHDPEPYNVVSAGQPVRRHLAEFHMKTGLPVLARLCARPLKSPKGVVFDRSISKMQQVLEDAHYPVKWRNGAMLVSHISSVLDSQEQPTFAQLRDLRDMEKRSGGTLTIDDMMAICAKTTDREYTLLAKEVKPLRTLESLRKVLKWLYVDVAARMNLNTPVGTRLSPEHRAVFASRIQKLNGDVEGIGSVTRLSMQKAAGPSGDPKDIIYRFLLLDETGRSISGFGVRIYQPQAEPQEGIVGR